MNQISQDALNETISYNKKSVLPKLDFDYEFSIDSEKGGYFDIVNLGNGLAEIVKIRASFDEVEIKTDAKTISDLGRKYGLIGFNFFEGDIIPAGGKVRLINVPARRIAASEICPQDKARKSILERLSLSVDYKSVYDEIQTKGLNYTSPNTFNC